MTSAVRRKRSEIFKEFDRAGVVVHGAEWNGDETLESAYGLWVESGRPSCARIHIQNDLKTGRQGVVSIEEVEEL